MGMPTTTRFPYYFRPRLQKRQVYTYQAMTQRPRLISVYIPHDTQHGRVHEPCLKNCKEFDTTHLNRAVKSTLGLRALRLKIGSIIPQQDVATLLLVPSSVLIIERN